MNLQLREPMNNSCDLYSELFNLRERLPHALLIYGADNYAKLHDISITFAKYVLCLSPLHNLACNQCESCILFANNTHPDIFFLDVDLESESKNKVVTVAKVREAIEYASLSVHLSSKKIVFVPNANLLGIGSSNALLKILEEPMPQVIFILLSTNIGALLATIKSRCYKLWLNPGLEVIGATADLVSDELSAVQLELLVTTLAKPSVTEEFNGKQVSFALFIGLLTKWVSDLSGFFYTHRLNYFSVYASIIANTCSLIMQPNLLFVVQDKINFYAKWTNHPLNYKLHIENLLLHYQQLFVNKPE
jgi:DNA polymerase III subunit delta'